MQWEGGEIYATAGELSHHARTQRLRQCCSLSRFSSLSLLRLSPSSLPPFPSPSLCSISFVPASPPPRLTNEWLVWNPCLPGRQRLARREERERQWAPSDLPPVGVLRACRTQMSRNRVFCGGCGRPLMEKFSTGGGNRGPPPKKPKQATFTTIHSRMKNV